MHNCAGMLADNTRINSALNKSDKLHKSICKYYVCCKGKGNKEEYNV